MKNVTIIKKNVSLSLILLTGALSAQDLTSINVGSTLPSFTFSPSTNELTTQMTVRNIGFFNTANFDVALFVKNTSTNIEYEVDRVNQSGLGIGIPANTLYINNWIIDLDNEPNVPSGNYRVIARINDNQNATETNYTNNTENFGNASFNYSTSVNSLNESSLNQVVKISPNPFVENIKINITEQASGTIQSYSIADINGKLITSGDINTVAGATEIFFEDQITSGIYVLQLYDSNKIFLISRKIIKR